MSKAENAHTPLLCRWGIHTGPKFVTAHTQAPAPLRCTRCGDLRFPPGSQDGA
jgi:hypothetical protein